jgi:hypothetical protein
MMKKISFKSINPALFAVLLLGLLILTSCANNEPYKQCLSGHTFGFWGGLWHGFIAPIDLVLMFFRDDIAFFAPNNNGMLYAFGFLLGSGSWGLFASKSKGIKKKCEC